MAKRTPLFPAYARREGVKLVDFGGWELPERFAGGILAEHRAVRTGVGLFDVSHMGEIAVEGPGAASFLDLLLTNRVSGAGTGRCLYSPMCRPDGGTVDDLLVYVLGPESYLLVVNAANTGKDAAWIAARLAESGLDARSRDVSDAWAQIALQGPLAVGLLSGLAEGDPAGLGYYRHAGTVRVAGVPALLSRTGYTGEDGFELYCAPDDAIRLWTALEEAGAAPCGLGARDVLRLEARLPLYGHELSDAISPLEAGLGMFVKWDKGEFVGRGALAAQKADGPPRRLLGLEMIDAAVARDGYPVFAAGDAGGARIGTVTSGGKSPVRDSFIALALVARGAAATGDEIAVEIRGARKRARVVKTPFYARPA